MGIHLMAKPAGAICNLDCSYCFYLEKSNFYPEQHRFLMSEATLANYIRQTIQQEDSPEVLFTWQGGEPLLRGMAFYRQALALQQRYAHGKKIRNSLQTNGVLVDENWCRLFAEHQFSIGISLDGPADIHDASRFDKQGRPTFDKVIAAIRLLQHHAVELNILVTVTQRVAAEPERVYQFLKSLGVRHLQFNPVVERLPNAEQGQQGYQFAPAGQSLSDTFKLSADSVRAEDYGQFLIRIFELWVRQDVGSLYVMNFEWALAAWLKLPATVCLFAENCGKALIVEHDGDVYSCDHFVYPDYRLGNLNHDSLDNLLTSNQQQQFGQQKSQTLPEVCRQCEYVFACHGECPKNRFIQTANGEAGLNYLCAGYKAYFKHIDRYMQAMALLINHQQPAALIMKACAGPLAITLPTRT